MKTYLLIIFSLLMLTQSNAQNFAPVGAKWHYGFNERDNENYFVFEVLKDTIISADTFSVIGGNAHTYYIKQENEKIYYWLNAKRCLLFDTEKQIGDTFSVDVYFAFQNKDTSIITQISIDTIFFEYNALDANDSVKVYKLRHINTLLGGDFNPGYYTDRFIKTLDFSRNLISIFNMPTTGQVGFSFRCFSTSNYNFKDKSLGNKPCDYIYSTIDEYAIQSVSIYPNPITNEIHINIENHAKPLTFTMYNSVGQIVKTFSGGSGIYSVDELPAGVYFLKFATSTLTQHKMIRIIKL